MFPHLSLCIFRSDKLSLSFFHSFHRKAGSTREGGREGRCHSQATGRPLPLRCRTSNGSSVLQGQGWDEGKRVEAETWLGARCGICQRQKSREERAAKSKVRKSRCRRKGRAGEGAEDIGAGGVRKGSVWRHGRVTHPRRTCLCSFEGCYWHQSGCSFPLAQGNGATGPSHKLLSMKVILLLFFNWVWSHTQVSQTSESNFS